MGRHNKSTQGISDTIRPLTIVVSQELWEKFRVVASVKALTLNDYIVGFVEREVKAHDHLFKALKKDGQGIEAEAN